MNLNVTDIIKYNTEIKIAGNIVEFKHYTEKNQLKGYSVDVNGKESIQARYERLINMFIKKGSSEKIINHLKESMINTIKENKRENFKKSNKRASDMVLDLVACNQDLFSTFDGSTATLKFLTLSFDPKQYDSKFEEYETIYKKNSKGQMYPVDKPIWGLGSRKLLKDYKHCYGEITKFFKRLSFKLYDEKRNVIKYICVPELHKSDEAFHFHIIMFNMPYLPHADYMDVWGNGGVYIERIPSGSAGMVAKYVAKYLAKNQSEKNASFEQYQKIGMENMKRYSSSRGLKKPMKRSVMLDEKRIDSLIENYIKRDWLEVINKEGDKYRKINVPGAKVYDLNGKDVGRGDQICYTFRVKNKKALNAIKQYSEIQQQLNIERKQEIHRKMTNQERLYIYENGMTDEYIYNKVESLKARQCKIAKEKNTIINPIDTVVNIDYANCLVSLKPVLR